MPRRRLGGARRKVVASNGEYCSEIFKEITKPKSGDAMAGKARTRIPAAKITVDKI